MSSRAFAAVGLRILGLWFILDAGIGLVSVIFMDHQLMAGMPGVHRRFYQGSPPISMTGLDFYLNDWYYVISHFSPASIGTGLRLAAGLTLLFASKPIARLVARSTEAL